MLDQRNRLPIVDNLACRNNLGGEAAVNEVLVVAGTGIAAKIAEEARAAARNAQIAQPHRKVTGWLACFGVHHTNSEEILTRVLPAGLTFDLHREKEKVNCERVESDDTHRGRRSESRRGESVDPYPARARRSVVMICRLTYR